MVKENVSTPDEVLKSEVRDRLKELEKDKAVVAEYMRLNISKQSQLAFSNLYSVLTETVKVLEAAL